MSPATDTSDGLRAARLAAVDALDRTENGRRPHWVQSGIVLVGFAWLAFVAVLVAAGGVGRPGVAPSTGPSPGLTAQVLGVTDEAATDTPPGSVVEAFDEMPMDTRPGRPWVITGDGAEVAALPTSVDRSLKLVSSTSGESTVACRPVDPGATPIGQVAMDIRAGRAPPAPVPVVRLMSGDTAVLEVALDSTGSLAAFDAEGHPSSSARAAGSDDADAGWQRLAITVDDGSGSITWQAQDTTGEVASGAAPQRDGPAPGVDAVCIGSPAGVPAAWIAIDDLLISE